MKRFKRKKLNFVCGVAALLFAFSGCGKKTEAETEESYDDFDVITVGFSQLGAESDWRVANTESIRGTFTRENGYDLMYDDAQQKQDKQIIAIRNFIQQEVDYIVLAPVTETGWDTVLQEAKDSGLVRSSVKRDILPVNG